MNKLFILTIVSLATLFSVSSFADTRSGGEKTNDDVPLEKAVDENTDIWENLLSKKITLATKSQCVITACSDVANIDLNDTQVGNLYHFVISVDDKSPGLNTGSERTLELNNTTSTNDPNLVPVCSTLQTSVAAGARTIYWLGSKANTTLPDTHVEDSSMSIECFDGDAL